MTRNTSGLHTPARRNLHVGMIRTDPDTYQPRSFGLDHGHIAELNKKLATGAPLDAIRVRQEADDSFTVLDGHHSLAAYIKTKWQKRVPALVYDCTEQEGQLIAVEENAKSRLQMSHKDKSDWAWKLTCEQPELSKATVAKSCGVGTTTVRRMRAVRDELLSRGAILPASWGAALRLNSGAEKKEWTEEERDEWEQAAHDKIRRNIAAHIVPYMSDHPGLVVGVLRTIMGDNQFARGAEDIGYFEGWFEEDTGAFTLADPLLRNLGPVQF